MQREQIAAAAKLSVAAGLKRALPMRWEFTWIGGLLRAGERKDCSGQALEAEDGGRIGIGLGVPIFHPWQGLVAGPHMGSMCHLLRACKRIGLKRAPYAAGVHVDWGVVEGRREEIAAGKRWRRKMAEGFELLRGAVLYPWQGLVTGHKRAPQGVHVDWGS